MTAIDKASNGDKSTAKQSIEPKREISVLREIEARALITLVCQVFSEVLAVSHEMNTGIYDYKQEKKVSQEDLCRMREYALTCLSTSEHYLLMLGSVLEDQATDAGLSDERAPYPVHMISPEATGGR